MEFNPFHPDIPVDVDPDLQDPNRNILAPRPDPRACIKNDILLDAYDVTTVYDNEPMSNVYLFSTVPMMAGTFLQNGVLARDVLSLMICSSIRFLVRMVPTETIAGIARVVQYGVWRRARYPELLDRIGTHVRNTIRYQYGQIDTQPDTTPLVRADQERGVVMKEDVLLYPDLLLYGAFDRTHHIGNDRFLEYVALFADLYRDGGPNRLAVVSSVKTMVRNGAWNGPKDVHFLVKNEVVQQELPVWRLATEHEINLAVEEYLRRASRVDVVDENNENLVQSVRFTDVLFSHSPHRGGDMILFHMMDPQYVGNKYFREYVDEQAEDFQQPGGVDDEEDQEHRERIIEFVETSIAGRTGHEQVRFLVRNVNNDDAAAVSGTWRIATDAERRSMIQEHLQRARVVQDPVIIEEWPRRNNNRGGGFARGLLPPDDDDDDDDDQNNGGGSGGSGGIGGVRNGHPDNDEEEEDSKPPAKQRRT